MNVPLMHYPMWSSLNRHEFSIVYASQLLLALLNQPRTWYLTETYISHSTWYPFSNCTCNKRFKFIREIHSRIRTYIEKRLVDSLCQVRCIDLRWEKAIKMKTMKSENEHWKIYLETMDPPTEVIPHNFSRYARNIFHTRHQHRAISKQNSLINAWRTSDFTVKYFK